ncbi:MAG: hypothetical protein WCS09_18645 [Pseudomonadota bacterium]
MDIVIPQIDAVPVRVVLAQPVLPLSPAVLALPGIILGSMEDKA